MRGVATVLGVLAVLGACEGGSVPCDTLVKSAGCEAPWVSKERRRLLPLPAWLRGASAARHSALGVLRTGVGLRPRRAKCAQVRDLTR